ncbi:MAG: DUF512 domain-containing protein [Acidimicrobiia bacterium]|nr:DUF512 domain-containing protein [Acidimicrobiia bacterium]
MPPARVVAVAPGSPAASAGLHPGDELLAVNGEELADVIRYQLQTDDPTVELELRRGGLERLVVVEKGMGEPLGLELASAVFDRVRTCDNRCPFCFVHQLPEGLRRTLYLKDDDFRLSFLYGNFTTLTRFTEADLERVVTERLSPLYVSIHATDPDLRARMLRNRRGATSLRWLAALLDGGIEVHGQVVVCPGLNDGEALEETLLGVLDRFPRLATVGLVPLGVSDHHREPELRAHTVDEARAVLETTGRWQRRFLEALGRRLVFAADEYHLMAGRELPPADEYEGFPQHENGVGLARAFLDDLSRALAGEAGEGSGPRPGFFAWVEGTEAHSGRWTAIDGAPGEGYRAPRGGGLALHPGPTRPVGVVTGRYGAMVLAPRLDALAERAGVPVRLVEVPNRFFGGNIAVTGLLTGADVDAALRAQPEGHRYLLPDVVLSRGTFLDDVSVEGLCRPVEVVRTDGASLVAALTPEGRR